MTKAQQTRFYFPAWSRAWKANWRTVKGRVEVAPGRRPCLIQETHGEPLVDYTRAIEALATRSAQKEHRALTADDLRHACHIFALGSDKTSAALTNLETDRVVNLFRLLADPDDLDAVLALLSPELGTVKRLLWYLEHCCQQPYVETIAADEFGTHDYRSLSPTKLHDLVRTMKHRPAGNLPSVATVPDPETCPF
jgi:hypothetical protein